MLLYTALPDVLPQFCNSINFCCRWHKTSPGIWTGVMDGHIWMLSQTEHELLYHVHQLKSYAGNSCEKISRPKSTKSRSIRKTKENESAESNISSSIMPDAAKYMADEVLRNYFQLDVNLDSLYKQFSEKGTYHSYNCKSVFMPLLQLFISPFCSRINHVLLLYVRIFLI